MTDRTGRENVARGGYALLIALLLVGPAIGWDTSQETELAEGQVVVEALTVERGEPARVAAAIQIPADVESVWAVMVDCASAPEFVPNMKSCTVVEKHDNHELIEHRVKLSLLLPSVTYVFRADYQPHTEIRFERVSGGLRHLSGRWQLTRLGPGLTQVDYVVALRPGFPVPRWLVRRSLKKDLPDVLKALRNQILKGAAS